MTGAGAIGWPLGASTLGAPGESLPTVIQTLQAGNAGYVELRAAPDALVHVDLDGPTRRGVRDRLAAAGIRVLSVASGVRAADDETDDPTADGPDQVRIALRQHLQLAADLGARFVRVFPGAPVHSITPFDHVPTTVGDRTTGEELAARRLSDVVDLAEELGVWPVLETHDSHPHGAHIARILRRVDQLVPGHRVGAIWDVLHPWRTGEEPASTWEALKPYLLNDRGYVQIKAVASSTVLTPVLQGSGIVPLDTVLALLAAGGYRGPLSLEWERTWYPQVPPLSQALPAAAQALAASRY